MVHIDHERGDDDSRGGLLRLGAELPEPVRGCADEDCDVARIRATDLYCDTHDHFLPVAGKGPSRRPWLPVAMVCLAVCAAFVLTAQLDHALPVFLAYALIGALVVALPLRLYPTARAAAPLTWVAACAVAVAVPHLGAHAQQVAGTLIVVAVSVAVSVLVARAALRGGWSGLDPDRPTRQNGHPYPPAAVRRDLAAGRVVAVLAVALGLLLGWAAHGVGPSGWTLRVAPAVRTWLLLAALLATAVAVLVLVVAGAMQGWGRTHRDVRPLLGAHRPRVPSRGSRRRATLVDKLGEMLMAALAAVWSWFHRLVVAVVNRLWALGVRTARQVGACLLATAQLIRPTGRNARDSVARAGRVLLLPAVLTGSAAWLATTGAEHTRGYLRDGALSALAGLVLAGLLAVVLLTVVWMALSKLPPAESLASALHTMGDLAPFVSLVTVVAGWTVGLPGTFGHGQVRVGWVTGAATALLVVAALRQWLGSGGVLDLEERERPA
jgi:hypothetical protein